MTKNIDEEEAKLDKIIATVKEQQKEHGQCFYQQGIIKELRFKYEEAYNAFKQAVDCQPDNIEYLKSAGLLGNKVADYEQAQQFLEKRLNLTLEKFGGDHPDTATSYTDLAENLQAQGKYDEAEPLFNKSHDIRQRLLGEDQPDTAISYNTPEQDIS